LRLDLPGIIGDFDADDLHWKGGKIGLACVSRDERSPTASALEGDLPGRHVNHE
jgi:hypothetical protein